MATALKWIMVLWTLLLLGSCFVGLADVGKIAEEAGDDAVSAGVGIGASIGVFLYWVIWGVGIVPMGIMALVFRKKAD